MGRRDKSLKSGAPASANSSGDPATPEPYNCTGNFPDDFSEIWVRSCKEMDYQPLVRARGRPPSPPSDDPKTVQQGEEEEPPKDEEPPPQTYSTVERNIFFKPSIQCEFEVEETKQLQINHAQQIHIKGWKVEEKLIAVLKSCLLDKLNTISLWHAGLDDHTFGMLTNFLPAFPTVKTVSIEGNPIPGTEPFSHLLKKGIQLHHLSLRNNQITDVGCTKIGKALGSATTQIPELLTLNLAFNHICDNGAKAIAEGLRMNRVLTSLSLASNQITDTGAQAIASSLDTFTLTHEEIVQRRKMMSERGIYGRGSSAPGSRRSDSKDRPNSNRSGSQFEKPRQGRGSSKMKGGKGADKVAKKEEKGKKETTKQPSKTGMAESPKKGNRKSGGKDRKPGNTLEVESPDLLEQTLPLLDPRIRHEHNKVYIPGCSTLLALNLSRNQIGATGMKSFLKVINRQTKEKDRGKLPPSAPGLMKLSLQKNNVPHDSDTYIEIFRIMIEKDPVKLESKSPDDELQSVTG